MSGDWGGRGDEGGGRVMRECLPHLLILLIEVGEGARDEATVTVSLHSSGDGECLA